MAITENLDSIVVLASLFNTLAKGNLILYILGACSLLACTVFIDRFIHLRKAEIDTNRFIISLRQAIRDGNIVDAVQLCEKTGGPISKIVRAGLGRHDQTRDKIENAMEMTGMLEVAQLEKNAKVLSIIAHVAPLIGLLGTVLGFIQAFGEMRQSGLMDVSTTNIGAAMEYALETTAAGLVVAIPTLVAYNYIVSRIEGFLLEIQSTCSEIVDLLMCRQEEMHV